MTSTPMDVFAEDEAAQRAVPHPAAHALRRFFAHPSARVGAIMLAAVVLAAVLAPWLTRDVLHQSPYEQHIVDQVTLGGRAVDVVSDDGLPLGPNPRFLLGVDLLGRDLLSRVLYGARVSLFVSTLGTLLSLLIGLGAGLVAGFYRGLADTLISRFVDSMMAIPVLLLAIALASVLRTSSVWMVIVILALVNWTYLARIARAEVLKLREMDFVEAARALGVSDAALLVRHLLPNLTGPVIVFATLSLASNILLESALSFLGVGIQPPTPSWGNIIQEGVQFYSVAWWITLFPGLAILWTVVSLNLVGEGLREALQPGQSK